MCVGQSESSFVASKEDETLEKANISILETVAFLLYGFGLSSSNGH